MLRSLNVPRNVIDREVRLARERLATSDREIAIAPKAFDEFEDLEDLVLDSVVILKGSAGLGRTLAQLNIREAGGALAIAKKRGEQLIAPPEPNVPLQEHDVIYLAGTSESLDAAVKLLTGCSRVDSHEWSDEGRQGILPLFAES